MKLERLRKFNTRDVYPGGRLDNDMAMVVKAGNRIFLRGQTGLDLDQRMRDPHDPAAQAAQAMENAKTLLEEAGSSLAHVCKVTTYLTDRAWRNPVYNTVARYLQGVPTVGTGLVVKGLAMPDMKVEIDIDAVIPQGGDHRRLRPFNTRDWFGQTGLTRESCMVVDAGDEIFLRGQTGAELDGSRMYGPGHEAKDAAEQADVALRNAATLLEEAGSSLADVCKTRVYIGDPRYREAVYQVLGRHLSAVQPCSTGLVMRGFARPQVLFEIDMAVMRSKGVPHTRLRGFHTDEQYRGEQDLRSRFCMAVRAGDRIHLRGQTGGTLDGDFVGYGDPGAQAEQAMRNVAQLLQEAGGSVQDICKITTYVSDRDFREPVYKVIGEHLRGVHPVGTGLVVDGFATTRCLVEIDVEAVVQG